MGFVSNIAPKPTAPATAFNLLQRAEASDQIVLSVAPNNVCGYISGRLGASRVCPAEDRCYFHPPPSSSNGGVICCGKTTCQYHATCINSRDYFQSSKCIGGCEVDNFTLKCTNSDAPYCNTVSWKGNTLDYWCNDLDITTAQSAALTYKEQKEPVRFTTANEEDISSIDAQMSRAKTGGTVDPGPTQTSRSTATETNNDDGGSETPVAVIVGGTVTGVVVLAAMGLGLFFFMRRKKKKNEAKSPSDDQQMENKAPFSPGQQPGVPYYYDPNTPQNNLGPNGQYIAELPPQQNVVHEADGQAMAAKPQELPDNGKPAELV
ncbi:uncharacterized protein B0J16DRAFT_395393 [Fusarium flagelliforme]|uniref:uncharacterized protein n=1 Tax=Fusarium flagelliforme TaxID=2675880 RepID=UPI001E8DE1DE|nr:uncharacterized protein B0J16DRAFT_395393 [Fusarium flagelliforme]KAH7193476.1 hypothetical protein B0J16DRAFT_395393 [Fusarium flagelliforme]